MKNVLYKFFLVYRKEYISFFFISYLYRYCYYVQSKSKYVAPYLNLCKCKNNKEYFMVDTQKYIFLRCKNRRANISFVVPQRFLKNEFLLGLPCMFTHLTIKPSLLVILLFLCRLWFLWFPSLCDV